MSRYHLEPCLAPRNGGKLRAIGITRISTLNQDVKSLADQQALLRKWVEDRYDGPVEWTFIEGQGSGECVDRKQVVEANDLVGSGQFDLVIMEDLARHMRRVHAMLFVEDCEDSGTRLIAINDGIDTCQEWRLNAFFAAMKHEQGNKDTSLRIKRTLRNRFTQGGVVQFTIFGYIKPAGATSDAELQKDPSAEPIYKEWFERLDRGETFSEIADWLNSLGARTGPFCRSERWTCAMVGRVTRNPILKGLRQRNRKVAKRFNKTGQHKSVDANPEDLLERFCPHLAFFDAGYYDRVLASVKVRNAHFGSHHRRDGSLRLNAPKKRVRYPGQTVRCGVCGRPYVFGGHGEKDYLMCSGAREYVCWNAFSLDGPLAARQVANAVFAEIEALPDFDAVFVGAVNDEARKLDASRCSRLRDLDALIGQRKREIKNLLKFVREGGDSPSVREDLGQLESELPRLESEKAEIEAVPSQVVAIPSASDIKQLARQSLDNLDLESQEFARAMRSLVTDLFVFPYRRCDGTDLVLKGTAKLQLANLLPGQRSRDTLRAPLERVLTLDLFEPAQCVKYREQLMVLRQKVTEREAAERVGITITAAQFAARLHRLMQRLGLTDPYVRLTSPPMDYRKLKRHLHPRYRFDPLPGFATA